MRLSSRRDRSAGGTRRDERDAALPVLSGTDAGWLRSRVVDELARAGVDDVVELGDHLELPDGTSFGLGNLAAALSQHSRLTWGRVVRRHARAVARIRGSELPTATADVLAHAVARVVADDGTTPEPDRWGPPLAPGLRAVVCLDLEDQVLGPVDLTPHGGWAAVGPAATAALRRLPAPQHRTVHADGGGTVETFVAPDVFGAARLLVLDELLAETLRWERPAHGLLVTVPNRHLLAVHALTDAGTVVGALRMMLALAEAGAAVGGTAVSPAVFYRSPDGTLERVTHQPLVDGLGEDSALLRAVAGLARRD